MIGAGKLRHRISIEAPNAGRDDFGQITEAAWATLATVWADIRPIGGREKLRAEAIGATLTHTVAVRYQSILMPPLQACGWRIRYGARMLNITAARNHEERNQWIIFDCEEGSLDGQ